ELGWFGTNVGGGGLAGSDFYFEDGAGIHQLASTGGGAPTVTDTVIAPGGCHINIPPTLGASDAWVLYNASCDDSAISAYGASSKRTSVLDFTVDPAHLVIAPAWPKSDGDPGVDPFLYFYLTGFDNSANVGSLIMRTSDGVEHPLGDQAALERVSLFSSDTGTHGYALIDVDGATGTFVGFDPAGATTELAHQVLRGVSDLIVNFDGQMGDFALPTDGGIAVVAQHVPPSGFLLRDRKGRWTAILHDYADSLATLSVTPSSLDFFAAGAYPAPAPKLELVATGVLPDSRTQFLTSLPGIAYLTHYDAASDTGRLEYRNLELEFTGTVSDGLANYISTDDGVIYSVPAGDNAGVWAVRAR
ncbi:MAG TPA: hypothetical protein VGL13_09145, partial [Polyangiaceae bacterium]